MTLQAPHPLAWAPTALTWARVAAAAIVPALLLFAPGAELAAAVLFVVAALTDWLDGALARRLNAVSVFGAALDHSADKALLAGALLGLAATGLPADLVLAAALLLARDFLIGGVREGLALAGRALPVAALGKWKAAAAMVGVGAALFAAPLAGSGLAEAVGLLARVGLWSAAALAVLSATLYLRQIR